MENQPGTSKKKPKVVPKKKVKKSVDEENYEEKERVILTPCMAWVKRGIASTLLKKAQYEDVATRQTHKKEKKQYEDAEDARVAAEYGFDSDSDDSDEGIPGSYLMECADDPYVTREESEDDEEMDSLVVKPTDNYVLVGHIDETCSLDAYVYNPKEECKQFVHHHIELDTWPLCIEWVGTVGTKGNYAAIGSTNPVVQVWDVDVDNPLTPVATLNVKLPKEKARLKRPKHSFPPITTQCLSWNGNVFDFGVLASGHAGEYVVIWDLKNQKKITQLTSFSGVVNGIQWHPFEASKLLVGSYDKYARTFDCRAPDEPTGSWEMSGEVEEVLWNHFDPFCFYASTDNGNVHYVDTRSEKPVWMLKSHDKEVTGIALSSKCPGMLVTVSRDKKLKVWDVKEKPIFIHEQDMRMQDLLCLASSPDDPFTFSIGSNDPSNLFRIWDGLKHSAVVSCFADRKLLEACVTQPADAAKGIQKTKKRKNK